MTRARRRSIDHAETIHLLNQRYYQQWHRAERLERELARVRGRWVGPLLGWLLYLKRRLLPASPSALDAGLPPCPTIEEAPGPVTGRVSIIIPFRDRLSLLRACLISLARTRPGDVEYVLVDNGSRDLATLRCLDRLRQRRRVKVMTC